MSRASSSLLACMSSKARISRSARSAGRGRRPAGGRGGRGVDGRHGVAGVGVGDRGEHRARRRVGDLESAPAGGGAPGTCHQQVGGHLDRVDDRAQGRVQDGHRAPAVGGQVRRATTRRASRRAARSPAWAARTMCSRVSTSSGRGLLATSRSAPIACSAVHRSRSAGSPSSASVGGIAHRRQQGGDPVDRLVGQVLGRGVRRARPSPRAMAASSGHPGGPVELHHVRQQGADPDPVRGVGDGADRVLDRVRRGRAGGAEGEPAGGGPEHHRLACLHVVWVPTRRGAGCPRSGGRPGGRRCRSARSCRRRRAPWPARRVTGRRTAVNASITCERASAPALAVRAGGQPSVSSGSHTAVCGMRWGLEMPTLLTRSGSVRTATGVTSDPVPAVVGRATTGSTGPGHAELAVVVGRPGRRA